MVLNKSTVAFQAKLPKAITTFKSFSIKFHSIARNITGDIVEDMIWRVVVDYEIDQIDTNLPPGSRFNFAVTDYQPQLLEDKKKK